VLEKRPYFGLLVHDPMSCLLSYFLFKQTKRWTSRYTEVGVFLLIYHKTKLADLQSVIL
jgi:hypothetical protein